MEEKFPTIGKISPEFFNHYIYPKLGAERKDVLVGPQHGVDIGIVDVGHNKVMAITTDPIFIVPQYGWEKAAWFAWHILASDVTTSGFSPSHISADWNLPLSITEEQFRIVTDVWHRESEKYGASIVTGHTARYEGTDYPMVGGATFLAFGDADKYLTPANAQVGDVVIITKGAAVESVGIFACSFPETIKKALGNEILEQGQDIFYKMSTVEDALTAAAVGVRENGVTSMHDATECGIVGGLFEIATASGVGMDVDFSKIPHLPSVDEICDLFKIDPLISISEGTLLMTAKSNKAQEIIDALGKKNIAAAVVGEVLPKEAGMWGKKQGVKNNLVHPRVDPFWVAFGKAIAEKMT